MGMPAPAYTTAAMVRALPSDGHRHETVHGELLVSAFPRPWHQQICMRLTRILDDYLSVHPVGIVFDGGDISWSADTLVQPDLLVVDRTEGLTLEWDRMRTLLLVIEVLSPSTARQDRFTKRRLYQEVGVPVYWIVNPEDQEVEVWTPHAPFPQVHRDQVRWQPAGTTDPLVLDLARLFEPI